MTSAEFRTLLIVVVTIVIIWVGSIPFGLLFFWLAPMEHIGFLALIVALVWLAVFSMGFFAVFNWLDRVLRMPPRR